MLEGQEPEEIDRLGQDVADTARKPIGIED